MLWENFKSLQEEDFRVLRSIERGMKSYSWVPLEFIAKRSRLSLEDATYRITRLKKMGLIQAKQLHYLGNRLTYQGYDSLAIHTFLKRGTISAIGNRLGVGKESVVLGVYGKEKDMAVKLHRLGLVSFKHARKKRRHLSERVDIFLARENALREWEALNLLYPEVSVPKPIDHTRHAILMGFLSGKQLSRVKVKEPKWWLNQIMKEAKKAWKLGIVHADLSEYNVLASEEGITLIDWCQWISSEDEGAKEIFREDMERVKAHFRRKYKVG